MAAAAAYNPPIKKEKRNKPNPPRKQTPIQFNPRFHCRGIEWICFVCSLGLPPRFWLVGAAFHSLHSATGSANQPLHQLLFTQLIPLLIWLVASFRSFHSQSFIFVGLVLACLFLCGAMAGGPAHNPPQFINNQTNQHSTQPQKQSICSFLLKLNDFVGLLHRSPLVSFLGWLPAACSRP